MTPAKGITCDHNVGTSKLSFDAVAMIIDGCERPEIIWQEILIPAVHAGVMTTAGSQTGWIYR